MSSEHGRRIVFIRDGKVRHEKRIDSGINCCAETISDQADCLQLKEELARWYE